MERKYKSRVVQYRPSICKNFLENSNYLNYEHFKYFLKMLVVLWKNPKQNQIHQLLLPCPLLYASTFATNILFPYIIAKHTHTLSTYSSYLYTFISASEENMISFFFYNIKRVIQRIFDSQQNIYFFFHKLSNIKGGETYYIVAVASTSKLRFFL